MNRIRPKQSRGFTLVEVAVVLFFMGIFVSFASTMLKNIALSSKLRDARDKLTTTSDAVQAWAVKKDTIPTIADIGSPADYWNKQYTLYSYSPATNGICSQTSTNLAVCPGTSTAANCSVGIVKDIAYMLVSNGDNFALETLPAVTNCPVGLTCRPKYEVSAGYDDVYKYVTLQELKKVVGCVESDSRLRIITNDLPFANVSSNTFSMNTFNIEASGGVPYVSGGISRYRWKVMGDSIPGLSFSPTTAFNAYTTAQKLRITGMPTKSGTFSITVNALDNNIVQNSNSKPFVITIKPKQ